LGGVDEPVQLGNDSFVAHRPTVRGPPIRGAGPTP